MAELLIGPLVSMLKEAVSSYLLDQYKVMKGMEEQREILELKLPAILDVIEDAEKKGVYRPGVNAWLQALKKASHQAIDVFDEFKYEALRRDARKKGQYTKLGMDVVRLFPAYNPIAFRRRMGKKLRRIVQTIDALVVQMKDFDFIHMQPPPPQSSQWRRTDPIMIDSEKDIIIRSRDEEMKKIMKILLDQGSNMDLMVLPIVGMGGLGKTTFAQLVYNDSKLGEHFDFKKWCCVSDDFDEENIARSICDSKEEDREKALQDLQNKISGKRCLIVLDDVWQHEVNKWEKLKACFKRACTGSAILITTRDINVAQVMSGGTVQPHKLKSVDEIFLKEIFEKRAFSLQKPEFDNLMNIVDKIVARCVGSPLAAKAIGSMLSTKTTKEEWVSVYEKNNICNDKTGILPILKLSYDNLPSHMKQCFAFCAMYPKDYKIDVDTLIQLWMANDYIPHEHDAHLETIGKNIFYELAWRSFFEDANQTTSDDQNWSQIRNIRKCKIHDLMHDIALSVLGKECVTITLRVDPKKLYSNQTRHFFSLHSQGGSGTHLNDFLHKQAPTLQTVLYQQNVFSDDSALHLPKYNSLRALALPGGMKKIRTKRWHLQHLRYLDLSENWSMKELPEEISVMYNLQTLNLAGCWKLCCLPSDMKYMTSLRHLYVEGCTSLKCMPPDLSELSSLQTLTYFVAGGSSGCSSIGELQKLDIGGKIEFTCMENVTEAHAKAAALGNKEKLTHLSLEWKDECQKDPAPDCHKKVLDALKPYDNALEMLKIVNYGSNCLPRWMMDLSFLQKHLTELRLYGFTMCEEFPNFTHLEALQILYLEKLDKLRTLCSSDGTSLTFQALKELRLDQLSSLESWVTVEGDERKQLEFPQLEDLSIGGCPKLATLPQAPKLKVVYLGEDKAQLSLEIIKSRYIMTSLSQLTLCVGDREAVLLEPRLSVHDRDATAALVELYSEDLKSPLLELSLTHNDIFLLASVPTVIRFWRCFGKLVRLSIRECDGLRYWPQEVFRCLASLKTLSMYSCRKLTGLLTRETTHQPLLPRLESLSIIQCECLVELFVLPGSLKYIRIHRCPKLKLLWHTPTSTNINDGPPPCLQFLQISDCAKFVTLANLPSSLKGLYIDNCQELRSLSGKLDVLLSLQVNNCNELRSLDSLGDLPSLRYLEVGRCKGLESLPGALGSYSALRRLTIRYCPAVDMKLLYKQHQQQLDSLEERDLSHANSTDPRQGPKLSDPKSWTYAIPQCQARAIRQHMNR